MKNPPAYRSNLLLIPVTLLAFIFLVAGCGGSSDDDDASTDADESPSTSAETSGDASAGDEPTRRLVAGAEYAESAAEVVRSVTDESSIRAAIAQIETMADGRAIFRELTSKGSMPPKANDYEIAKKRMEAFERFKTAQVELDKALAGLVEPGQALELGSAKYDLRMAVR